MRTLGKFLFQLLAVLLLATAAAADDGTPWSGVWDVTWRTGGAHMRLAQVDASVTGDVPLLGARIEGRIDGLQLVGIRAEGGRTYALTLVLDSDGRAFNGRDEVLGWCNGVRLKSDPLFASATLETPRDALAAFVRAATEARMGVDESWGRALQSATLDPTTMALPPAARLQHLAEFFDLVDLTTFELADIPDESSASPVTVELRQLRSDAVLPLTLERQPGAAGWRVVIPGDDALAALRKQLLAIYGAKPPTPRSFEQLQSPRDAMRAFLEGMADWRGHGRKLALSTLDLSEIPEPLRHSEGNLAAGFLCRTLYRIGFVGLQSIPNDPTRRDPVVVFTHPKGALVIAPSGPETDAPWKFTGTTVSNIRSLSRAIEDLPPAPPPPSELIPATPFFEIASLVQERAPALTANFLGFAAWQTIAVLASTAIALLVAHAAAVAVTALLRRRADSPTPVPLWFRTALTLPLAVALLAPIPDILGIPPRFMNAVLPPLGSVATISAAFVAWHLVTIGCASLMQRAQSAVSAADVLTVNLLLGCLRIGILAGAFIAVAYWWSVPGTHVIAGLGIGGLGIAFASQQTIAQFFGAGVIVGDRPFRVGDWIQCSGSSAGTITGTVESVGLRSTRVRSADGSVLSVPNNTLATSTVVNLGRRRPRAATLQVTVTEGATLEKVEHFIATLRERISGNPVFVAGRSTVGVSGVAKDGIQVQCVVWLDVITDQEEADARHALLVDILSIAATHGLGLGPQFARNT